MTSNWLRPSNIYCKKSKAKEDRDCQSFSTQIWSWGYLQGHEQDENCRTSQEGWETKATSWRRRRRRRRSRTEVHVNKPWLERDFLGGGRCGVCGEGFSAWRIYDGSGYLWWYWWWRMLFGLRAASYIGSYIASCRRDEEEEKMKRRKYSGGIPR